MFLHHSVERHRVEDKKPEEVITPSPKEQPDLFTSRDIGDGEGRGEELKEETCILHFIESLPNPTHLTSC